MIKGISAVLLNDEHRLSGSELPLEIYCYQQGRSSAIKKVISEVKKLPGYVDWTDGGCTYEELVDRDTLLRILKELLINEEDER